MLRFSEYSESFRNFGVKFFFSVSVKVVVKSNKLLKMFVLSLNPIFTHSIFIYIAPIERAAPIM